MLGYHYVWLIWSSAFLIPWLILYWVFPEHRRQMFRTSVFTAPFGLTEPLFVPEYWNPPSLFNLAQVTGFDIESLIFCFAIGGVGAVLYNILTGRTLKGVTTRNRHHPRHRYHLLAMATPLVVFPLLFLLPWNVIYPSIVAMMIGALATALCRPELTRKVVIGGLIFLAYYAVFMILLKVFAPGYIATVWQLNQLSGFFIIGIPIEELLFGFSFGMYWAGVYEHFTWRLPVVES